MVVACAISFLRRRRSTCGARSLLIPTRKKFPVYIKKIPSFLWFFLFWISDFLQFDDFIGNYSLSPTQGTKQIHARWLGTIFYMLEGDTGHLGALLPSPPPIARGRHGNYSSKKVHQSWWDQILTGCCQWLVLANMSFLMLLRDVETGENDQEATWLNYCCQIVASTLKDRFSMEVVYWVYSRNWDLWHA